MDDFTGTISLEDLLGHRSGIMDPWSGGGLAPGAGRNRQPTPRDLLELASHVYKGSRKLHAEAEAQGMRIHHDELLTSDVRLVMLVPAWWPRAGVSFDFSHLNAVSVAFALRGTMQGRASRMHTPCRRRANSMSNVTSSLLQDLCGNTRANMQLLWNKIVDDQLLPDVAGDATRAIESWVLELLRCHPQLDAGAAADGDDSTNSPRLDVHVTGHSLGGLLAEVVTVELCSFAAEHGMRWHCTSWESPGLPDVYHAAALRSAPSAYWKEAIITYLAAPNIVNMMYGHLGQIVHVVVPFEQTWSHVAKCVGADVARVAAWAIVSGIALASARQLWFGLVGCPLLQWWAAKQEEDDGNVEEQREGGKRGGPGAAASATGSAALMLQRCAAGVPLGGLKGLPPRPVKGGRILSLAHSSTGRLATSSKQTAAATEAAVATAATRFALTTVLRRSGLGALASGLSAWLYGGGSIWSIIDCLAGVLGVEVDELIAQHRLHNMTACMDPHTGQVKQHYRRDMESWPQLGRRRQVLLATAQQMAKWTVPSFICRDNAGVMNLGSRTQMVELRCARLKGYVVKPTTLLVKPPECSELTSSVSGGLAPSFMTQQSSAQQQQEQQQQVQQLQQQLLLQHLMKLQQLQQQSQCLPVASTRISQGCKRPASPESDQPPQKLRCHSNSTPCMPATVLRNASKRDTANGQDSSHNESLEATSDRVADRYIATCIYAGRHVVRASSVSSASAQSTLSGEQRENATKGPSHCEGRGAHVLDQLLGAQA